MEKALALIAGLLAGNAGAWLAARRWGVGAALSGCDLELPADSHLTARQTDDRSAKRKLLELHADATLRHAKELHQRQYTGAPSPLDAAPREIRRPADPGRASARRRQYRKFAMLGAAGGE